MHPAKFASNMSAVLVMLYHCVYDIQLHVHRILQLASISKSIARAATCSSNHYNDNSYSITVVDSYIYYEI